MNRLINKELLKSIFTVCFEGNIGSGKSTSLQYLSQKYSNNTNILVKSEPIDKWLNFKGHNFIQLLYNDINRWSFAFEHLAQLTRLQMYANIDTNNNISNCVRLMERSIFSARHCFTENLFQSGHLTKAEYIVIDEWFKWLSDNNKCKVDLIVYLRTSPQTVYQRIQNRSRSEEKEIPFDYLKDLHKLHDEWLLNSDRRSDAPPVITLNADLDREEIFALLDSNSNAILGNAF